MKPRRLPAVLTLLLAATAHGAPLGRLFFTPAQRSAFDQARQTGSQTALRRETPSAAASISPSALMLNGIIQHSDGRTTVWVNHQRLADEHLNRVKLLHADRPASAVTLQLPHAPHQIRLKVGQHFDAVSGKAVNSAATHILSAPSAAPPGAAEQ